MAVSHEQVQRIAELARLRPDPETVTRLTKELNGILEHIERLEEVALTDHGEGIGSLVEIGGFRDPELPPDPLAAGAPGAAAPQWQDGFFLVPRLPALDTGTAGAEEG